MKILVTGASGFLGYHLCRRLSASHEVIGIYHEHPVQIDGVTLLSADLTSPGDCRNLLSAHSPDCIVHAAAMTDTGACERDPVAAQKANVEATGNLLRLASTLSPAPYFLFLSTDLVFSGEAPAGGYSEDSANPAPLMAYGRAKLAAESLVTAHCASLTAAICRSALIYGPPTPHRSSFVEWMIRDIRSASGAFFSNEYRTPIHIDDLCAAIESACNSRAPGLYHLGGPERLSRYEFALEAAAAFGLPAENVHAADSTAIATTAPRPRDVSLNISKARHYLGFAPRTCRQGLDELARLETKG